MLIKTKLNFALVNASQKVKLYQINNAKNLPVNIFDEVPEINVFLITFLGLLSQKHVHIFKISIKFSMFDSKLDLRQKKTISFRY